MKQTTGTILLLLMAVAAWGQAPATPVQNSGTANTVQQKKAAANTVPANNAKAVPSATASQKPLANAAKPASAKVAQVSVKTTAPAAKPATQQTAAKSAAKTTVPVKTAQSSAKAAPSAAKPVQSSAKLVQSSKPAQVSVKAVAVKTAPAVAKPAVVPVAKSAVAVKPAHAPAKVAVVKMVAAKPAVVAAKAIHAAPAKIVAVPKAKTKAPSAQPVDTAKVDVKDTNTKPEGSEKEKKESSGLINVIGKRDPFMSPVTSQSMTGSGCSVGKKCLAIDQITVRGVVKSDSGMIAVVVNALDKAYFLRENDPVFNGYVEKITEDSIIFKEMYQDKLGKPFTRDVTKRIPAPSV